MQLLQHGLDWWDGLERRGKAIAAALGAVGIIAAGPIWMFSTFATASDMKAQMGGVKEIWLESEIRRVKKELFEYEVAARKRTLLDIEERRVRELQDELKDLLGKLERLHRGS